MWFVFRRSRKTNHVSSLLRERSLFTSRKPSGERVVNSYTYYFFFFSLFSSSLRSFTASFKKALMSSKRILDVSSPNSLMPTLRFFTAGFCFLPVLDLFFSSDMVFRF
ncbi:MAG: hypothetical protein U5L45_16075 [Saprospiraceae bacterium]|nr:hypothetical protein [Saprospiraceae bacterium]